MTIRAVVVGASVAGLRAAEAIRETGHDGPLTILGEEPHPPYSRPPLSKELLAGKIAPGDCSFTHAIDAEWRLGSGARALDRARRTLRLDDGDEVPYDRLVIATGRRARPWPGPGRDLEGVVTLRSLDDALRLRASLENASRIVIIGGGFIGCEAAATLRQFGHQATIVEIQRVPMSVLGSELGQRCLAMHLAHGIDMRLGVGVRSLLGSGSVEAVVLDDGTVLAADLVLVGLGAIPNVEWLQGSGLDTPGSLVCDSHCMLEERIACAGDVARWPTSLLGGQLVTVEHWTHAAEQGRIAGRNVMVDPGERLAYDPVPSFWSDQYGVKIQAIGLPAYADSVKIVESSGDWDKIVARYELGGSLIGVCGFNRPGKVARARAELGARITQAPQVG
jgi:NADPH-dependent 2,4-dienoyl-CoA reductase/sulfur reductase-like enzyme